MPDTVIQSIILFLFRKDNPSAHESLLLGAGARSISGIVMLPITVIKTRFEVSSFGSTLNICLQDFHGNSEANVYTFINV